MASGEDSTTGEGTSSGTEQNHALVAMQRLIDSSVQSALQPITSELRTVMGQLQSGISLAPSNTAPPPSTGGEPNWASISGGIPVVSDPYQPRQGGGVAGVLGAAALGAVGSGCTPSGSGALPQKLNLAGLPTFNPGGQAQGWGLQAGLGEATPGALGGQFPLLQPLAQPQAGGIIVSYSSPPVPTKLATKIWNGEYVDLNMLLPFRLGAPEPSLVEALQGHNKEGKQITTIQQWVVCFNAYMSVLAIQQPNRIRDLLASIIVKAANDYEGNPWLSYDVHFRSLASSIRLQCWGRVDQALRSQHFCRANTSLAKGDALSIGPYNKEGQSSAVVMKSSQPSSRGKDRVVPYQKVPLPEMKPGRLP